MTTLTYYPTPHLDKSCGKGWEGSIGDCKRAKVRGVATLGKSAATWGAGKVVGGAVAGLAQQHGIPGPVAARIAESATQALFNTALSAKGKNPRQLATSFISESISLWSAKDPNTVDDAIAGGDDYVKALVEFALSTTASGAASRMGRQATQLSRLMRRRTMRLDASPAEAIFDLSIVAMVLATKSKKRQDRACGKGWKGTVGECKRAKATGLAVHGGEMVAAWAVGKVAGGALTQLAMAHGIPHEAAKVVSESSMQALAAVAIHAVSHRSTPRKLAGVFVTQAAAAAAGKIAHGEVGGLTAQANPTVHSLSSLVAGKGAGLGTVQAVEKNGKVLSSLLKRMKGRRDAIDGQQLTKDELNTLMQLGVMGLAMALRKQPRQDTERVIRRKKKAKAKHQCGCQQCAGTREDAVLMLPRGGNLDGLVPGKPCGNSYISRRKRCSEAKSKLTAAAIKKRGGIDKLRGRQRDHNKLRGEVKRAKGQKASVIRKGQLSLFPGGEADKPEPIRGRRSAAKRMTSPTKLKVIRGGRDKSLPELFQEADRIGSKYQGGGPVDLAATRRAKKEANKMVDEAMGQTAARAKGTSDEMAGHIQGLLSAMNETDKALANLKGAAKPQPKRKPKTTPRNVVPFESREKRAKSKDIVAAMNETDKALADLKGAAQGVVRGQPRARVVSIEPKRAKSKKKKKPRLNLTKQYDKKIADVRKIKDPDKRAQAARGLVTEVETTVQSKYGRGGRADIRRKVAKLSKQVHQQAKPPEPKRADKPIQIISGDKKATLFKPPGGKGFFSIDSEDWDAAVRAIRRVDAKPCDADSG